MKALFFYQAFLYVYFLIATCFNSGLVYAQGSEIRNTGSDTLHLTPKPYMPLGSTDSLGKESYTRFYRNMKSRYADKPIQNRIFNLIFDAPSKHQRSVNVSSPHLAAAQAFSTRPIGNIRIKRLKPFGYNIADTTRTPKYWYQNTGNDFHVLTQRWVIKKNLLFDKGDQLQVDKLADTERLLRQQPFIRDARIYLETRTDSDTVDVVVITEDVFSYAVGGSWGGFNRFSGYIENFNIFGIGHELFLEGIYNADLTPRIGYQVGYGIPNIGGTFINTQVRYHNTERENSIRLSAQRPFYSPDATWAGGFSYFVADWKKIDLRIIDPQRDSLFDFREATIDTWLARAFPLPTTIKNDYRNNIVLAGLYTQSNYGDRPTVTTDISPYFFDRRTWVGSLGFSAQSFRRDKYVFGFGRTEDVPEGYYINLLGGLESTSQTNRPYLGLEMARGNYIPRFGYLRGEVFLGTFFNEGKTEQAQSGFYTYYFSPLIGWKKYNIRQFVRLGYIGGSGRRPYEYLTIRDLQIRGLFTDEVRGTRRINATFETLAFTPVYILGFQLAVFSFADLAHLSQTSKPFHEGDFFQGYGFGINVRNDNLVFQTFQLRFSFYPGLPTDNSAIGISLKAIPQLRLRSFRIDRPNILPFQ